MATKILIPTPLRPFTDKLDAVEVDGATIGELLQNLTTKYGGLKQHLYSSEGKLRSFVNIYVNDDDIRYLQKDQTPLKSGDTVSIIPSVAGGAPSMLSKEQGALPELSGDEIKRYSRHLIMPEVGLEGQRKLKAAKVLCIGAGGLGSPAAMYLAAAGIGTLGIVDFDVVDFSNLQRQIIHGTPDVGRAKLASAKDRLNALNPNVHIETYEEALSSENALRLFEPYDVDPRRHRQFPDALSRERRVRVARQAERVRQRSSDSKARHGLRAPSDGPCYRCLYPEPPPPGLVPSCAEAACSACCPDIIGTLQATEAIKLILGSGEPLIGRLLIYDALQHAFRELKLRKDPECPVCGDHPTITGLIDYEQFCGVAPHPRSHRVPVIDDDTVDVARIEVGARSRRRRRDRRRPRAAGVSDLPAAGCILIPLGDLPKRLRRANPTRTSSPSASRDAQRESPGFPSI